MHEEFVILAKELIDENGRSTTFSKTDIVADVNKPWQGNTTPLVVLALKRRCMFQFQTKRNLV